MSKPVPNITIPVDLTNPGQFFACCGLLELTDRLWLGAEGWFEDAVFRVQSAGTLPELWRAITKAGLQALDTDNETSSPMQIGAPFDLTLDWWNDVYAGGRSLKVWAGSMRAVRIAQAMKAVVADISDHDNPFDYATVVYDPDNPSKKVEPFYFDARRGWNAQPIDIGFSPDSLKMTSMAFPVVEFLCLVGLQRFRPQPTDQRRVFDYHTWRAPLAPMIASTAVSGLNPQPESVRYRFENAFRTDQKKHKSFLPSTLQGA